jgi:hypothetical protein
MATEYVFLTGKLKWVRVNSLNQWNKWSAVIYPNQEGVEKLRELQAEGMKNIIKKDDDGWFCTFTRPNTMRRRDGTVIGLAPPLLLDGTKQLPDGAGFLPMNPDTGIGNGSDGVMKLEVYSHGTPGGGKAKAARLFSIRIDNLIPFEPKRDFTVNEEGQARNFDEQPKEQLF